MIFHCFIISCCLFFIWTLGQKWNSTKLRISHVRNCITGLKLSTFRNFARQIIARKIQCAKPIHLRETQRNLSRKIEISPPSLVMSLGISPISLLLDKSMLFKSPTFLNSEIAPFHTNTKFSRLKSKGTPARPRRDHLRTSPTTEDPLNDIVVKLLDLALRIRSFVRLVPIHAGIGPINLFSPTSNITNSVQFFIDEGNSEFKLFFPKCNMLMVFMKPMELGIFPDSSLFAKTRILKECACDQQSEYLAHSLEGESAKCNSPLSLLSNAFISRNLHIFQMDFGISPSRVLLLRSREIKFPNDSGMIPTKSLEVRSRYVREAIFSKPFGMTPLDSQKERSR
ncbi:hypothetical protein G4B88_013716 [Cannabis sativa]|uniref:Uncharacterized protein n=1 Tax=Cannabis sativa TaxID=3483 RepID=A0A7J6HTL4_CANSA|nr:hypothetical protein G4B88_013716 [Cannabis sativa]